MRARSKERADVLLVERGLAASRAEAQAKVLAGEVKIGDQRVDKAGALVDRDADLSVASPRRFVSRGGDKLEGALAAFEAHGLDVRGMVALDVGASTGGFTDCLLQRGAEKVFAIDVGKGQLADKLRKDPRVVSREGMNARDLDPAQFDRSIDVVVVDASFIGLAKLLDPIARVLTGGGALVALVKPQFEAGREAASKGKGVIRDEAVREAAIEKVKGEVRSRGFTLVSEIDSAVKGPKGNVERFLYAVRKR